MRIGLLFFIFQLITWCSYAQYDLTAYLCKTPNVLYRIHVLNVRTTTRYGWLFRHLTTNGTFGPVGKPDISDANNRFHHVASSGNTKVFRIFPNGFVCDLTTPQPTIYTDINNPDNVDQSQSKVNNINDPFGCAYRVWPANADPVWCNPNINIAPEGSGDFNKDLALQIATEAVQYTEFETVGENFDERELYASLLNQDAGNITLPVLNTFYLNTQGSALAQLAEVDRLMGLLIEPATLSKPLDFTQYLADAKTANAVISSTEVFVQNEKQMNEYQ